MELLPENTDILHKETVKLFHARFDPMGYKQSWILIVGESYNPTDIDKKTKRPSLKSNVNFEIRAYIEHERLLNKIGCVLPLDGEKDYSATPFQIVLEYSDKYQARRIAGGFNQYGEAVTLAQANERPKPVPMERYEGKFRTAEEIAAMKAEEAKTATAIAPIAPATEEITLEARLARMLADAEAVLAAMPNSMIAAQMLFNLRYLNGAKFAAKVQRTTKEIDDIGKGNAA